MDFFENFSQDAKRMVDAAREEASKANQEYVGTEHLLRALIRDKNSSAAQALRDSGVDIQRVMAEIAGLLQGGPQVMTDPRKFLFSPRARRALDVAVGAAAARGQEVGPEHLLAGMIVVEDSVAAQMLSRQGIQVEWVGNRNSTVVSARVPVFGEFTSECNSALNNARQAAKNFRHEYIGTEHLLLGVLYDDLTDAAELLVRLGVSPASVRAEIRKYVQEGKDTPAEPEKLPFTPRAKRVVEIASEYIAEHEITGIGTCELLIALLLENEGIAAQVLRDLGVTLAKLRFKSGTKHENENMTRHDGRANDQLRDIRFTRGFTNNAQGSVLVEFGQTRVLCTAMYEDSVPFWKRGANNGKPEDQREGWLTAEYGMLPSSTNTRKSRDKGGKVDGRSVEIQRLIGRSLRAIIDLKQVGERTIWLDCDVIQADGGTRTASITGAYVALWDCLLKMKEDGKLKYWPLIDSVAAVSVGILNDQPILDLDYKEDFAAETDMNVVMTGKGHFIEVQGTAEERAFPREQLNSLIDLAAEGIAQLTKKQKALIE